MAKVNVLDKNIRVGYYDIIKFQLHMACFSKHITLSESEFDCLIVLCMYQQYSLSKFCELISNKGIFKTPQTVRNFLSKAEELNLIKKTGSTRKIVSINNELNIITKGNILLKYKVAYVAEKE